MRARRYALAGATAALLLGSPAPANAQELGERIERSEGEVAFHYKGRAGIEGCGDGSISMDGNRWHHDRWRGSERACGPGPVLVVMDVRDGEVRDLDVRVGPRVHIDHGVRRDFGRVSAVEASAFLLDVARTARGSVAEDAVFPAFIADSATVWPELIELARNRERPEDVRSSALFWVGQEAAGVATEGLADVARDEDEDQRVREAAVFALSQRPQEEGIPILMDVARTAANAGTRKSAMFWLAQSDDPDVLHFFEEILLGSRVRVR